jgi:NAD-dependent dihydropyrimidine dehydrogenase PreA subunit
MRAVISGGAWVGYHGHMALRNIIRIDEELCDGCGECVPSCAEGALRIVGGKARLVSDVLCDGLGACLGECPTGALTVIQREATEFDEAAVATHVLAAATPGRAPGGPGRPSHASHMADSGCPSAAVRVFPLIDTTPRGASTPLAASSSGSKLRQWPVQLHLVPPTAPFFQGRHVLLAADCVPVAVGDFHASFLDGRGLAIACPKLDQRLDVYVQKLAAMIDQAGILSLTVAVMEVPCCGGLVRLAEQALAAATRTVPLRLVTIGIRGDILLDREA